MNLPLPEDKKLKILILSAPIGNGHQMAANALEEALLRLENTEVVQGNVFDFFPDVLGRLFLKIYERILKYCPGLYAMSYRWGNQGSSSLRMRNIINSVLLHQGKAFIERIQPDIVFSTHATPTGILSLYKQKYDKKVWLGVVVTDFTVHRWLVCPGVDAYFLADGKLKNEITSAEAPQILSFGIPVRSIFAKQNDISEARRDLRHKFGWDEDAFVCLLAGGGGGMLPMENILRAVTADGGSGKTEKQDGPEPDEQKPQNRAILKNLHVIAVTGHNDVLYKKLKSMEISFAMASQQAESLHKRVEHHSRLAVLGFTEEMPLLMEGSDLVITKAGGVSMAECLACGANPVIYNPLPGQEQANAVFLQKEYGVRAVADSGELIRITEQEMRTPLAERLHEQKRRKESFGYPDAAEKIAEFTKNLRI